MKSRPSPKHVVGRCCARGTSRVGGTAGLCVLHVRSAQPQTRAHRRRLSTLWSRSTLTPPTKGADSLGAAEMGEGVGRDH